MRCDPVDACLAAALPDNPNRSVCETSLRPARGAPARKMLDNPFGAPIVLTQLFHPDLAMQEAPWLPNCARPGPLLRPRKERYRSRARPVNRPPARDRARASRRGSFAT
jgi:hypothetical protein